MSATLKIVEEDGREYEVTGVAVLGFDILIYTADALYTPYRHTGKLQNTGYFLKDGAWRAPLGGEGNG
jgi:hypothetical protein